MELKFKKWNVTFFSRGDMESRKITYTFAKPVSQSDVKNVAMKDRSIVLISSIDPVLPKNTKTRVGLS